jgi:opacity protein-like surface antigen
MQSAFFYATKIKITMKNKLIIIGIILLCLSPAMAQNTRINDQNQIGWYNYFGTFKIAEKFSFHTEFQARRTDYISDKQQNLTRVGFNYQANPKLLLRLGYAWIETYPYGEYAINGQGKDFNEHRIFQMATLTDKISKFELSHRFMLEQRFVGRYSKQDLTVEDEYVFMNRIRYMFRIQMPLKGTEITNKTPYIAAYDEIIIGFGKNVNENIFDQNRIGLLLGYRLDNNFRIEAGYLNQKLQLGREINQRNVFQSNNGFIINTMFNFDLRNKTTKQ